MLLEILGTEGCTAFSSGDSRGKVEKDMVDG
jgi:hypothetical protein